MSAFALYLFFMLDSFKNAADVFLTITIVTTCVSLAVFGIGFLAVRFENYVNEKDRVQSANDWCSRWLSTWKWWRRIIIPVFCVSLAFKIFLPNTKQAVAIYIIPKVINAAAQNKELMELPQDIVRVAKLYLNKVMVKWSTEIEQDLSVGGHGSTIAKVDSTVGKSDGAVISKAEQAVKDAKEAYDKSMQALEAAKKVIK